MTTPRVSPTQNWLQCQIFAVRIGHRRSTFQPVGKHTHEAGTARSFAFQRPRLCSSREKPDRARRGIEIVRCHLICRRLCLWQCQLWWPGWSRSCALPLPRCLPSEGSLTLSLLAFLPAESDRLTCIEVEATSLAGSARRTAPVYVYVCLGYAYGRCGS